MMSHRRAVALVVAGLVLASPSAALAQSAGDEQYANPFGGSNGSSQGSSGSSHGSNGSGQGSNGSGQPSGSSGTSTPTTTTSTPTTTTPTTTTTTTTSSSPTTGSSDPSTVASASTVTSTPTAAGAPGQLPYTGANAGLIALAGAFLLGSGVALRVRLREQHD